MSEAGRDPVRPRVLSVHPSVGLNGAGKSWCLVLEALQGHCELWTSQPGPASAEVAAYGRSVAVDCPQISRRLLGNVFYVVSFPYFVFVYLRIILLAKIDVVHCNGLYLLQPMVAARLCGRRLVIHVREAREKYPRFLYRLWVLVAELLADTLICVSQLDQAHFARRDVAYVPNWMSENTPARNPGHPDAALPATLEGGSRVILLVSQIIEGKGHDYAIDIFDRVRRRTPGVRLHIAGGTNGNPNNERFREMLVAKVERMGLAGEVVFLGQVADILPMMKASGCVLMPSRSESFSRVHLEAMSCGCLLIATDVGMTSRIVDDMVDGVIIPWGDAGSAAEKISGILADPARIADMRAKAVRKVASRFSAKRVVPEFRQVFFGENRGGGEPSCAGL